MKQDVIGSVMIVGGGIGAIQAALLLADSGYAVHMVEKNPSIGGVMAQLDKTFPTNDCAMCIMSPKLVEVGRHPNIHLITLAEVRDVRGAAGRFQVDLFQKARYVNPTRCIACGACAEKCPTKVDDLFNGNLGTRKAVYVQYPQAVPLKYAIDPEHCLYFKKGKCRACEKFCPAGAIDFNDTDRELTIEVGSLILAPGFRAFDPSDLDTFSYSASPDVLTALEFERLLSASGPTMGHLIRMSDHKECEKVAWIQCVGSRSIHRCDHGYCSSVCCMYAIKQAIIAKEHSEKALDCSIFYMDMRTHGKGFEECYNDARDRHGVHFERSRVHTIQPLPEGGLRMVYADVDGTMNEETFDLAVLSVGMEIPEDVIALSRKLDLKLTPGGFAETSSFSPVETSRKGIYVCGAFQGPKDIPQTVIEAGSAAMMAGSTVCEARGTETVSYTPPEERMVTGESPRVGVFVCHCGTNIGGVIDVPGVRDYAKDLPHVEYVADNLYTCSQDTQDIMSRVILENGLNRIVVAACTPKTHEPLFQETLVKAGLNKYLFEMVNIRNHGSWVHRDDPARATEKAKDLVRMAVAKVSLCEPLDEETLEIDQRALVLGGGISGMAAALCLADQGYPVHLIERDSRLGGQARSLFRTARGEDVQEHLEALVRDVQAHENIRVHLGSRLTKVDGFVGSFESTIASDDAEETLRHGVTIVATGASEHRPGEYLYGKDPRVVTASELDHRLLSGELDPARLNAVAFIQCVGSREPDRPYCSRVCCTHTMVSALHLKKENPEMTVVVLYRDIRTYGEREYLFQEARERGVIFLPYDLEHKPEVASGEDGLIIRATDPLLGRPVEIHADLLTLASAVVPHKDEELARFFKIPMDEQGFFVEAHVKLAPFEFATDGVFLCGLAHYPKPIDESVAQAQAAASRAMTLLARKTIATSGTVAYTNPASCSGCGVCISLCPYKAPGLIQEGPFEGKAEINPVLCKGCGLCVASCRSGAINLRGFETGQIMAMIDEM